MEERCKHLEEKSQLLCDLANEKSNNLVVTGGWPKQLPSIKVLSRFAHLKENVYNHRHQSLEYLLVESSRLSLDDNHTENEICLYNDLKATRVELEKHKQKIEQLEQEKQEIIDVMHQAAVSLRYFWNFV